MGHKVGLPGGRVFLGVCAAIFLAAVPMAGIAAEIDDNRVKEVTALLGEKAGGFAKPSTIARHGANWGVEMDFQALSNLLRSFLASPYLSRATICTWTSPGRAIGLGGRE